MVRTEGIDRDTPLAGREVALVSMYYFPESTGNAPYATEIAGFLAEVGARTTVIAGYPHYPEWRRRVGDPRLRSRVDTVGPVTVLRAPHTVPRRSTAPGRALYEASFSIGAAATARGTSADVVIGMTPTLAAGQVAAGLARRNHAPLVLIVADLVGVAAERSGISGGSAVALLASRWEASILRRADAVITIAPSFSDALLDLGIPADRIHHVAPWSHVAPSERTVEESRRMLGWDARAFTVVHTGNMGHKQGLEAVVEAARLAQTTAAGVRFVLVGDGNQRAHLQSVARGVSTIEFVDPLPDELYPEALNGADALLVNERPGMVGMSLPSKLTSYLPAGRPIVASVPHDGDTARLLAESGAAVLTPAGDSSALLRAALELRDDETLRLTMGAQGRSFAQQRTGRAAAVARLRQIIEETLTAGR